MIITVASNKGGVGKTNVVVNIAPLFDAKAVLDLDAHASFHEIMALRETPPAYEYDWIKSTDADQMQKFYDYITPFVDSENVLIIDCGGYDSDMTRAAIAMANFVLVPSNEDLTELIGIDRLDGVLADLSKRIGSKVVGHCMTYRFDRRTKRMPYIGKAVESSTNLAHLETKIPNSPDVKQALGTKGLSVYEDKRFKYGGDSRLWQKLVAEIKGIIAEQGA